MEEIKEEKEGSLKEEVRALSDYLKSKDMKTKKFRQPANSKISKKKMKEGFATVVVIEDNRNLTFTREQIVDGTIKLNDTFHAIDPNKIFYYKNKPFIFQPKRTINPYDPLKQHHQTYGQKYIIARMEGDKLITKKKMGWGLSIGLILIVGVAAYYFLAG